jgi:hypothetical protein
MTRIFPFNINLILLICFFILLTIDSLGLSSRWVMNESLFGLELGAYKSVQEVKVPIIYMPGIPLMGSIVGKLGFPISFILYSALSVSVLFLYINVFIRRRFTFPIEKDLSEGYFQRFLLALILIKFLFPTFFSYSLELKGDALCLSLIGFFIIGFERGKFNSVFKSFLFSLVLFLPLLIKQQYIFVSFSVFVAHLFLMNNSHRLTAILGAAVNLLFVSVWFFVNENAYYWVVQIPSDDGFRNILEILKDTVRAGGITAIFACILVLFNNRNRKDLFLFNFVEVTFIISLLFICLLSLAKNGGNIGNIEIFFATFCLILLSKTNIMSIKFTLIAIIISPILMSHAFRGFETFSSNIALDQKLETLSGSNHDVLVDSHSLFAVRHFDPGEVSNSWVTAILQNQDPEEVSISDVFNSDTSIAVVKSGGVLDKFLDDDDQMMRFHTSRNTNAYKRFTHYD